MHTDLLDDHQQTSLRYYYNLTQLRNITLAVTAIAMALWGARVVCLLILRTLIGADNVDTALWAWYMTAIDELEGVASFITMIGMVFFFLWLYRAYYNLERVGLKGLTITAGWAVGWFFIPIVNIFYYIPIILNTILRGSKHIALGLSPMQDFKATPAFPLGVLWVIIWLTGSALDNIADYEMEKGTIPAVRSGLMLEAIANIFTILSGLVTFYIVFIVSKYQHKVYTQEESL